MTLKINGKRVFFTAIESLYFDEQNKQAVIRTVSGDEARKSVKSEQEANEIFDSLELKIAMQSI